MRNRSPLVLANTCAKKGHFFLKKNLADHGHSRFSLNSIPLRICILFIQNDEPRMTQILIAFVPNTRLLSEKLSCLHRTSQQHPDPSRRNYIPRFFPASIICGQKNAGIIQHVHCGRDDLVNHLPANAPSQLNVASVDNTENPVLVKPSPKAAAGNKKKHPKPEAQGGASSGTASKSVGADADIGSFLQREDLFAFEVSNSIDWNTTTSIPPSILPPLRMRSCRHPLHYAPSMPLHIVQQGFHTHPNDHGIKKVRD